MSQLYGASQGGGHGVVWSYLWRGKTQAPNAKADCQAITRARLVCGRLSPRCWLYTLGARRSAGHLQPILTEPLHRQGRLGQDGAKALSGLFCFWRQGYKASILDSIDDILALLLLLPDNQPLHLKLAFCLAADKTRLLRGHLPDLPRIAVTQLTEEALVGSFATSCVLMFCCDVVPAVLHLLLCCACQA